MSNPNMEPMEAEIRVFSAGKELKAEEDGFIGSFEERNQEKLGLEISLSGEGFIEAFKARVIPSSAGLLEITLEPLMPQYLNGEVVYKKEVFVHESQTNNGLPTTKWPKNHIKIVFIHRESDDYIFNLWEPGIVTQIQDGKSNFFLVNQLAHQSPISRNRFGNFFLPNWPEASRWLELWQHIRSFIDPEQLPLYLYEKEEIKPKIKLQENTGVVLWYNFAYQVGAIEMSDLTRRVYWSEILTQDRFKHLKEGQLVKVGKTRPAMNTHPYPRVTNFEEDALEVAPIKGMATP